MGSLENKIVFVVGMHRSGTSMLTKILNICGMNIGSDDELIPAHESNPKGHFEHIDFYNINIEVLKLLDGNTFVLPVVKENWEFDIKLNPLLEKAKKLVDRMNQKYILWGVKDPRISFTLPFWKTIIPNIKIIIPFRHYVNVSASILKRDFTSEIFGELEYQTFWHYIIKNTENLDRLFVKYDDLIDINEEQLKKIEKFINHKDFFVDEKRLIEAKSFIDNKLRHHVHNELSNLERAINQNRTSKEELLEALSDDTTIIINKYLKSHLIEPSEFIKINAGNLLLNEKDLILNRNICDKIDIYKQKEIELLDIIKNDQIEIENCKKVIKNYEDSISLKLVRILINPIDKLMKNNPNYKSFIQNLRSISLNKNRFKGPDFIIIGAARSGTTSLFKYLSLHPRIKLPSLKELHYFYFRNEENKTIDWYLNQFPQLEKGQITGEATPYYIFHPLVPQIIKKTFPNVKIIALLRDPIDRAVSHYFHCRKHGIGVNIKDMGIQEAFEYDITHNPKEEEKLINNPNYYSISHQHNSFVLRGDYKKQLKRWENHFNKKNIKVIKSEDFYNNSFNSLNQICDFLGIEHFDVSIMSNLIVHNKVNYNPLTFEEKQNLRKYFTYLD